MKSVAFALAVTLLLSCFCINSYAQPYWLTLTGDSGNPQVDIVEVQPESRSSIFGFPTLNVRVNRATLKSSHDGIPYRSYLADVAIDCAAKTGRYTTVSFYMMPLWEGKPHKTISFTSAEPRLMLFSNIEPNPTSKIIRAACFNTPR